MAGPTTAENSDRRVDEAEGERKVTVCLKTLDTGVARKFEREKTFTWIGKATWCG